MNEAMRRHGNEKLNIVTQKKLILHRHVIVWDKPLPLITMKMKNKGNLRKMKNKTSSELKKGAISMDNKLFFIFYFVCCVNIIDLYITICYSWTKMKFKEIEQHSKCVLCHNYFKCLYFSLLFWGTNERLKWLIMFTKICFKWLMN